MKKATTRFSDRVENYIRYRPGYPDEIIEILKSHCKFTPKSIVADIGSGTGILTKLFLDHGNKVFAVEPNAEMREPAEESFKEYANFISVGETAEATGLESSSIDHIIAGQAFHWFDREKAKREFSRILKPDGWVSLIWNDRLVDTTPFLVAYEAALKKCVGDYESVNHKNIDETVIKDFYAPGKFKKFTFANSQTFDSDGLKGRALSCSYVPNIGETGYEEFISELENLFENNHNSGFVKFEYSTALYCGQLDYLR